MKHNITFKCEHGKYKLEARTKLPTEEIIKEAAESLEAIGCGKMKQIIIDIIEL